MIDDDAQEYTEELRERFEREGVPEKVAALIRARGRPKGSGSGPTKELVSLRIDREVLAKYRATGPGWQTKINDVLAKAVRS